MTRPRRKPAGAAGDGYEPTPAEIRRACIEIQDGWTEKERQRRSLIKQQQWAPPAITDFAFMPAYEDEAA